MAGRYRPKINHNSEFELDLAPLLAVMVKLVPVLLISSAFVQLMIVETELPQVVQQAITQQAATPKPTLISMEFDKKDGVKIITNKNGAEKVEVVGLNSAKEFDYPKIHEMIEAVKKQNPEVFKIEFNPSSEVQYKEIVKMMDEVRKSRSNEVRFPVKDEKTGQMTTTDYMFPEVVFTNMFEG